MEELDIIELFIDESNNDDGVYAISLVEFPAIESNFVALNQHRVEFKTINEDKRIIVGLALVPNKKIYRRRGEYEYYIQFSEDTVRKASEIYLKSNRSNHTTLEHQTMTNGVSVIESWIVEDERMDKSNLYGLNATKGAWVVTMKIDNDNVWQDIKDRKYLGLSIEGLFSDNFGDSEPEDMTDEQKLEKIIEILKQEEVELKTYSDYPQAARNNAKRALKWKKENGSSCGTSVGWKRANQLASGEALSRDTIARMASFKRHQKNKDVPYSEGCGGIVWDCWGGSAGINWAISKLKKIDNGND